MQFQKITEEDLPTFKAIIKKGYMQAYENKFGKSAEDIINNCDIEDIFVGYAWAFQAVEGDDLAGGIIMEYVPGQDCAHYRLSFAIEPFDSNAVYDFMIDELEKQYPEVKCWIGYAAKTDIHAIQFFKRRGFRVQKYISDQGLYPNFMIDHSASKEKNYAKLVKTII